MASSLTASDISLLEEAVYEEQLIETDLKRNTLIGKVDSLYPRLKRLANEREVKTYKELTENFTSVHSSRVGDVIEIISLMEHKRDRPLLSAIVVSGADGVASEGFFTLLKQLGEEIPEDPARQRDLWEAHVEEVHDFWANVELTPNTELETPDQEEKAVDLPRPERVETRTSRIVRDTQLVKRLKNRYDHRCQVCGERRWQDEATPYAEGHHIKPLGGSHQGPDSEKNILILCPNHHSDFDYGVVQVDPDTYEISHPHEDTVDGEKLHLLDDHEIDPEFLEYHNRESGTIDTPESQ